jgi:hypothetical protein
MPGYVFPGSRYEDLGTREYTDVEGRVLLYLERRFPPRPETLASIGTRRMGPGERLDHAAEAVFGDPLRFWALCDANGALDPAELETAGHGLRVAAPPGVGGLRIA